MTSVCRYIGLMTGTSVDGIDVALIDVPAGDSSKPPKLIDGAEYPIDPGLRATLRQLAEPGGNEIDLLGQADHQLGEALADATLRFLQDKHIDPAEVRAIGSHGQTVRHRPDLPYRFTLQIGDPTRIAGRTGIDTVADFRRADVAAGGQGAPLVPLFHQALFAGDRPGVVLNIGGISNITVLPGDNSESLELLGFDTGPGNALMDIWCDEHTGSPFDEDGAWAASGAASTALLERLLADPFFSRVPPKSTGREAFTAAWLQAHIGELDVAPVDVQATLAELTARSIAEAIRHWAGDASRCVVAGGGRRNSFLMARLQHTMNVPVEPCESIGVNGDLLEAAAFGWLAHRHLERLPGSATSTTGAEQARVLGALYPAG